MNVRAGSREHDLEIREVGDAAEIGKLGAHAVKFSRVSQGRALTAGGYLKAVAQALGSGEGRGGNGGCGRGAKRGETGVGKRRAAVFVQSPFGVEDDPGVAAIGQKLDGRGKPRAARL